MVVGTTTRGCQTVVIGGGPGGYLAAIRLAQLGKDVMLVEESPELGGVCLKEGCIPSKALIHAVEFLEQAKKSKKMGITVEGVSIDVAKMTDWKNRIVKQLTSGVKFLATKNGAEVVQGRASFDTDRRLEVFTNDGPLFIEFEQAVIATGSLAMELPEFPVDGETVLLPAHALSPVSVPETFVVIGGGYIGLELGSVYRRLGAEVHIVEVAEELLPFHDPEVRQVITRRMKSIGVKLHLGSRVTGFMKGEPSQVTITGAEGRETVLDATQVMVSIGRKPATDRLNLDGIKLELDDRGFIRVNDRLETNIPGIYAVGDVVGGPLLAHKAYREAKVAAEVIAGQPAAFDNLVIPAVVYTDPELAWAGLTEKEARDQGYKVVTGTFPFKASGRAMTLGATEGFVKSVGDAESKRLLGVTIVGRDASEMIAEAALAIEMGAFLDDLSQTIHPHPTLSEGLLESVEAALGEAIHILNQ